MNIVKTRTYITVKMNEGNCEKQINDILCFYQMTSGGKVSPIITAF